MKIAKASHKIIEAVVRTELVEVVLSGELVDVVLSGELIVVPGLRKNRISDSLLRYIFTMCTFGLMQLGFFGRKQNKCNLRECGSIGLD